MSTLTLSSNLVDAIWRDQPPVPRRPVRVHPVKLAGVAVPEKFAAVRKLVVEARASSLVVMAMDEVIAAVEARVLLLLFVGFFLLQMLLQKVQTSLRQASSICRRKGPVATFEVQKRVSGRGGGGGGVEAILFFCVALSGSWRA